MENYEVFFLKSLVLTVIIELFVLFLLIKIFYKKYGIANNVILFAGILASVATLPYLWFILPYFIINRLLYILISEIFAVLAESLIYYYIFRFKYSVSLFLSFACNMVSFLTGLILPHAILSG